MEHSCGAWLKIVVVSSSCQRGRWLGLLARQFSVCCASAISSGTGSVVRDEMATSMVEIANRMGQLETNIVTELTARMDAEQHVQTLTAQLQAMTRKTTTQVQAQMTGLIDTMVGRTLASWTHLRSMGRLVDLHRTAGQGPDEHHEELKSVGNSCHERGLARRPAARQQLDFAIPARDDRHRKSVGHRCQRWRR